MKKTIILTALNFIPKAFQYKAVCKALNYICAGHSLDVFNNQTIKLNLSDLRKTWFVTCVDGCFKTTKNHNVSLEVKTKLNTALNLQGKIFILDAVKQGDIQINGKENLIDATNRLLSQLDERRLVNLSAHLFSFLKIKSAPPARLDINTVQLSDLRSDLDINFIRDQAVKLEKTDLQKALFLMSLAHQARPKGPFIAKKVNEYTKMLNS